MSIKNEGVKNLIPLPQQTKEVQREIQSKGGKKSVEVRRKKKAFAETFRNVLDMSVKKGSPLDKKLSERGIELDKNADVQTAMLAGLVVSATNGNVHAYQAIKEAIGEAGVALGGGEYHPVKIPAELLGKMYVDLNRHISNGMVKEAIIKGGRGSLKSSFPGLKIPELIMANPSIHGLCLRNVKDTLKDSVYEQIKWGIEKLGVAVLASVKLEKIHYAGTVEQWNALEKNTNWFALTEITEVICSDGTVTIERASEE
jgi:hypothetical protein